MEPASTLSQLPSFKNLRAGQRRVVDLFNHKTSVVAQLPTGYGKTRTASCSYLLLRHLGVANRMLYVVPRSAQASQAAEDVPRDLLECGGVRTSGCEVGYSATQAMSANRRGSCEVFVITVQALVSSSSMRDAVVEMMSVGRWFVVIDEHHHYGNGEDTAWTSQVKRLPSAAQLAMSATPDRKDGPSVFGPPDVRVSYMEAVREGAVKLLNLHSYEYRVDAVTVNGEVISLTTDELVQEVGSSDPEAIEKYATSRQMKWSPKYISPLVLYPLERMGELVLSGIKSQMLVQALSCSHAKMVCDQIRSSAPDGVVVDWVGTGFNGRSDEENRAALLAFCPPKNRDGKRDWKTHVLVNVGMAGEGLDCQDVTEVVFLTSPRKNNTTLQAIGRGARVMKGAPNSVCTINVDGASELAGMTGPNVMGIFDGESPTESEVQTMLERELLDREYTPLPDEPSVGILNVTLVDIKTNPLFQEAMRNYDDNPGLYDNKPRDIVERRLEELIFERERRDSPFNQTAVLAQLRDDANRSARKVAGLIVRKTAGPNDRIERTRIGDILKNINGQAFRMFGAVKTADESTLKRRYQWLKQIEASILSGDIPGWA